ncbi:MAG: sigma-70 family RNA polymerase sigma factor [Armatimonadota bacterium]|nr:sigma-70 family RNA polymerase sigma factor [Armatimonadota bacterium]MDR7443879.1 sigma-70 family RNA polymerase sigma factor [Armatimonadota bacterium]MDR7615479.1 sigma-70 family RNA polymerase sigma factor [Armatimonadota bacterium]
MTDLFEGALVPDSPAGRPAVVGEEALHFEAIVHRYGRHVYNIAYRLSGNEADAKDLTQEAFLRVYRALPRVEPGVPLEGWLYRIVLNLFIDHLRKRGRMRTESLDVPVTTPRGDEVERAVPDESSNPEEQVVSPVMDAEIQNALGALAPDLRAVVVLVDIQGFSYEEVASILRVPIGTVKSRLHRARRFLRDRLAPFYRPSGIGRTGAEEEGP